MKNGGQHRNSKNGYFFGALQNGESTYTWGQLIHSKIWYCFQSHVHEQLLPLKVDEANTELHVAAADATQYVSCEVTHIADHYLTIGSYHKYVTWQHARLIKIFKIKMTAQSIHLNLCEGHKNITKFINLCGDHKLLMCASQYITSQ